MKNQYVGDQSDYLKYALLRAAQGEESPVFFCWMLTEDDGGPDGKDRAYLSRAAEFRPVDPTLFDFLEELSSRPTRSIADLEGSGLFPRAGFHSDLLSDQADARARYFDRGVAAAPLASLVFLEPDNGTETKLKRGRKGSSKYVYWDEIEALAEGRSLLVFQHWHRKESHDEIVETMRSELGRRLPDHDVFDIRGPRVLYLFATQPDQTRRILAGVRRVAATWPGSLQVDPPDYLKPDLPPVFAVEDLTDGLDDGPFLAEELEQSSLAGSPWGYPPGESSGKVFRLIAQEGNLLTLEHQGWPYCESDDEWTTYQLRIHPLERGEGGAQWKRRSA